VFIERPTWRGHGGFWQAQLQRHGLAPRVEHGTAFSMMIFSAKVAFPGVACTCWQLVNIPISHDKLHAATPACPQQCGGVGQRFLQQLTVRSMKTD
jgi:hypothetical protein